MLVFQVNYLAVIVAAVAIFVLGGLWYSPVLFAKRWTALQGRTEEQMRADAARANMPAMYLIAFISALIIAWAMAVLANTLAPGRAVGGNWVWGGVKLGLFGWFGFVLPTTFATSLFSMKPRGLWLIDAGYNLVSFVIAGAIILGWMGATAH
jgi:Protein of unknown function (DUF1761)